MTKREVEIMTSEIMYYYLHLESKAKFMAQGYCLYIPEMLNMIVEVIHNETGEVIDKYEYLKKIGVDPNVKFMPLDNVLSEINSEIITDPKYGDAQLKEGVKPSKLFEGAMVFDPKNRNRFEETIDSIWYIDKEQRGEIETEIDFSNPFSTTIKSKKGPKAGVFHIDGEEGKNFGEFLAKMLGPLPTDMPGFPKVSQEEREAMGLGGMNFGMSDGDSAEKTQKTVERRKKELEFEKPKRVLDLYGTNLNERAKKEKIDEIIGRDREISRIVEILNRRKKNNPCIIGEAGVGKTALAQGLALKIVKGDVPYKLRNKEIYLLDMGNIVAGTQFRGQFEARLDKIIEECKELGNIILVIDEIHTIVKTGEGDSSASAANILKPSLANGEIQLIGTTTIKEYRKYIEKDAALERRFQTVMLEEPNKEETGDILKGIKEYYQNYHKVIITDSVISETVRLCDRYINDRFFPDKAIDVIDEACSRINLADIDIQKIEEKREELAKLQERKEELMASAPIDSEVTEEEKNSYYEEVASTTSKIEVLETELKELEKNHVTPTLKVEDIAKVIEEWTKIPVNKITEEEKETLKNLETRLRQRVIGQEEALSLVSKAVRRNRAGLQSSKRPPSFIFVGPTGVGKTELAKALAEAMFADERKIIRVDMSEYMEKYSVSKLIGAAPGYVGYDEGGNLTERVRKNPYSIILLDEIEKANPEVFNILLQVLEDGILTDSQGRQIDFSNTIIIMTSNAGSNLNVNGIGFGEVKTQNRNKLIEGITNTFRPEFLNRIDEIICFEQLDKKDLSLIFEILIKSTRNNLKLMGSDIEITNELKEYIIEKGTDMKNGARPLRRSIQKNLEDKITDLVFEDKVIVGTIIKADYDAKKDDVILKVKKVKTTK